MPSYDVKSGDASVLAEKINSTQTTGLIIAAMNINGTTTAWANTAGVIEISEQSDATLKREWVYYTGTSVDATSNEATLSGVVRGIARDSSDVTSGSASNASAFAKGATVRFVTFHDLLNKKANLDRAGTFSAAQTIASAVALQFGSSSAYIKTTDSGTNLKFKDASNSETTLTQLAAGAGTDTKTRVSSDDTTSGFLNGKLTAGDGITFTEGNGGADETLAIAARLATDPGLEISSNALRVKASTGITRDLNGISVDTTVTSLRALAKWFGDGSDGAKTIAASEDLDPTLDWNYTSLTLDAGQTLSVSSVNTPLVIRVTGDATINGTINLDGKGGPSSAGGAAGVASAAATAGKTLVSSITTGAGGAATSVENGRGGGGGASIYSAGAAGSNSGGAAGATLSTINQLLLANLNILVGCGGGGSGGGGDSDSTDSTDGSAGGGALLMYVGGNLTLGAASVITADSANTGNSTDGGSGGTGGGGTVVILVGGTITDGGVTCTATAGTPGTAGSGSTGGAGGAGKVIIYSLVDNTVITA